MSYYDDVRMILFIVAGVFFSAEATRMYLQVFWLRRDDEWSNADKRALILMFIWMWVTASSFAAALHYQEPATSETLVRNMQDRVAGEFTPHY